eukprot:gnl/MRDRNA2_/MRDRNA2_66441_c0_seq1.p1 gnl/MRDRNA2_/MRDRNA2_66441_c0~~gnl/MRDRNA2_/MRDRNA2_66441_c0_seq1.p1  ORF type:complete len:171 (+),score=27.83 gnl/MRDRNA2_/MRDRNA2_66441_c0_seq1:147-659(+)
MTHKVKRISGEKNDLAEKAQLKNATMMVVVVPVQPETVKDEDCEKMLFSSCLSLKDPAACRSTSFLEEYLQEYTGPLVVDTQIPWRTFQIRKSGGRETSHWRTWSHAEFCKGPVQMKGGRNAWKYKKRNSNEVYEYIKLAEPGIAIYEIVKESKEQGKQLLCRGPGVESV